MPYVIINGINSNTINGLLIQNLPPIIKAPMRTTIEEIDGKNGSIVTKLGYGAYEKSFEIGLKKDAYLPRVMDFFNSEGLITFSDEPNMVYKFHILRQIDYTRLIRYRTATITLYVQPFKYSLTEEGLSFSGSKQLIEFIDFVEEKNGITVEYINDCLRVQGLSTQKSVFFIPIEYLQLENGEYFFSAYADGENTGESKVSLCNDTPFFGYFFGDAPLEIWENEGSTTSASYEKPKPFNYIYLEIPGNKSVEYNLYLKVYKKEQIKILNKGNVYSNPTLVINGKGDIRINANGENNFFIRLGLENTITIDTDNMEAYNGGVLKNRLVLGDYDDFKILPGVNFINYTGLVDKITIKNYSRWV